MFKNFKPSAQSGASMVVILVGLALTGISVVAASTFFTQNRARAVSLLGDSEALTHWSMLLRQSYKDDKCLELDELRPRFKKNLDGGKPFEFSRGTAEESALTRKGLNRNKESISYVRNSLSKNYELAALSIVQRSNVIGTDPGRVVADLKVTVKEKSSPRTTTFTVPMLLDLDNKFQSIACMQVPDAEEICKKNNGAFNEKNPEKTCSLPN